MKPLEVRWIIESGTLDYTDNLIKYLKENDIYYKETNYQEVILCNYNDKFGGLVDSEVASVFVGSLRLAKEINKYPIDPGVICTLDNFKYYPSWNPYLLNSDWSIKMKCLLERDIRHLETHDSFTHRSLFFRPDNGDKSFTGGVFTRSQIAEYIKDDELVIQASTKNIGREYRFLVIDRKVICGCKYLDDCSINKLQRGKEYLEQVLKTESLFMPNRAFTVDIRELAVVELNSFSCANLYSMNMDKVVPSINKLAKDMYIQNND